MYESIGAEFAQPIIQRLDNHRLEYWMNSRGSITNGNVIIDIASGNHSTLSGAIKKRGPIGQDLFYFDGSNDSIVTGSTINLNLTTTAQVLTLAAWVNMEYIAGHTHYNIVGDWTASECELGFSGITITGNLT